MLFKKQQNSRTDKVKKKSNTIKIISDKIKMQSFPKRWSRWTVVSLTVSQHQQQGILSCHHSQDRPPLSLLYCLLWWCSFSSVQWEAALSAERKGASSVQEHTRLNKNLVWGPVTERFLLRVLNSFLPIFFSLNAPHLLAHPIKDSQGTFRLR